MVLVVNLLLLAACSSDGLPPGDPQRPDVILVSIDSLRPDRLGAYGHDRPTSPFIDSLAASGLRYTEARAPSPWTLPSHVTMLSGRSPLDHGVVESNRQIPAGLPMVQEAFQKAGYRTAGFVSTIFVSESYGFARGFDRFEDFDIALADNLRHPARADLLVTEALSWARAQEDAPIFLFVHLYDVHYPYLPPEPWNYQFDKPGSRRSTGYRTYDYHKSKPVAPERWVHLKAQYDESLAYVDAQLARLGEAWAVSGRKVDWVVTSDHGEELGERGSWGHGHTLYPEVMRVPLIVSGASVPAAGVRDERVGLGDVPATLAALGGLSFSGEGVDVRGPVPERDFVFDTSRKDSARLGLLSGNRRLDVDLARERIDVFHVDRDPAERIVTLDDAPELEARLYARVGEAWSATGSVVSPGWLFSGGKPLGHKFVGPGRFGVFPADSHIDGPAARNEPLPAAVSLSEKTREQLKALGYTE